MSICRGELGCYKTSCKITKHAPSLKQCYSVLVMLKGAMNGLFDTTLSMQHLRKYSLSLNVVSLVATSA